MKHCKGNVIVFSDIDSLLRTDSLSLLHEHFRDPADLGGVCGQRIIGEHSTNNSGQQFYIETLDSRIKQWESTLGELTSNDGKLYAIRKSSLVNVPDPVADDFFHGLEVLRQRQKMIFDERLIAHIRLPSRDLSHEMERRRRIVCRSLCGLWLQKEIFNVFKYGLLSLRLFINKVLRRFIPHALLLALLSFNALTFSFTVGYGAILIMQLLLLTGFVTFVRGTWHKLIPVPLYRPLFSVAYITAGLYGTLLGTMDFLRGESYATWTPKKS